VRGDYLIAGILLMALGVLQLWANGRWPFRPHMDADETPTKDGTPETHQGSDEAPVAQAGGLWRSWTRVAGYVAVALGVIAVILAAIRG
jgi:hypothetical protein